MAVGGGRESERGATENTGDKKALLPPPSVSAEEEEGVERETAAIEGS